jgi:regulator of sigma E protease
LVYPLDTLNWLPLGGFVRPLGEDFVRPVSDDEAAGDWAIARKRGIENPKSVNQAGPWQRILFMSAGAIANFLTAIVIFTVMALLGLPVVRGATVAIRNIDANSPAAAAGLQTGDVIVRADNDYIDSATSLLDLLATDQGEEVVLTVERGEEQFEVPLAMGEAGTTSTVENVQVIEVVVDSPAGQAGLLPDDIVLAANGEAITSSQSLIEFTNGHQGEMVDLLIEREGETLTISLRPRTDSETPANQGPIGVSIATLQENTMVGITLTERNPIVEYESASLTRAIGYGLEQTWRTVKLIFEAPIMIIRGELSPDMARPVSIVGLSQIGGQRLEQSFEFQNALPILDFAAVISLALGLTNLLPIPGLDGGRILFVFIELLRGKPMDPEREGLVHMVGLLLLLGTMGIVIINDIINPITQIIP